MAEQRCRSELLEAEAPAFVSFPRLARPLALGCRRPIHDRGLGRGTEQGQLVTWLFHAGSERPHLFQETDALFSHAAHVAGDAAVVADQTALVRAGVGHVGVMNEHAGGFAAGGGEPVLERLAILPSE